MISKARIMAYPTSRKKYYLQATIKAEWVDPDFFPDLIEHIQSNKKWVIPLIFPDYVEVAMVAVSEEAMGRKYRGNITDHVLSQKANYFLLTMNCYPSERVL